MQALPGSKWPRHPVDGCHDNVWPQPEKPAFVAISCPILPNWLTCTEQLTEEKRLMLGDLMQAHAERTGLNQLEGSTATAIPGVHFFRAARGNRRQPLVYQSGILIMGQGHKVVYLGEQQVRYGAGAYLVVGVPLPLECEAFCEDGVPILGLKVDVEAQLLHRLVEALRRDGGERPTCRAIECGLSSVTLGEALQGACQRLLQALADETEARILGPAIVEEIIYRVLTGPSGHVLLELAHHDGHYARIARVLNRIHRDYAVPLTVERLAEEAHMSVSAFHRAFRRVTLESPLQYLKKVRLNKARELILLEGKGAAEAADLVGYRSPSQFSREFKRHFNHSPKS